MSLARALPLFVYGTLLDPVVQRRVTGEAFRQRPASLSGYRRFAVHGKAYPAIVAAPNGAVHGALLLGIGRVAFMRLDAYEGRLYRRLRVCVREHGGRRRTAWVYVLQAARRRRLAAVAWDPPSVTGAVQLG